MKTIYKLSIICLIIISTHPILSQVRHTIYINSSSIGGLNNFDPGEIYAKVGDTIVWIPGNKPIINHTITTIKFPEGAEPINYKFKLPSDTIFKYIVKFSGQFYYECIPHSPYMLGNIWVTDPNGIIPDNIVYNYSDNTPQLAPNPAMQSLTFYQLDESIKYTVKVYNELGNKVKEFSIMNSKEYELNLNEYPSGNYTAHLAYCACKPQKRGCGGAAKTLKFVKQ